MAEVFWNPVLTNASGYVCQSCGTWVMGFHNCQPARAQAPMDPNAGSRELARIALALERIADALEGER